jgi:hypothetical protein
MIRVRGKERNVVKSVLSTEFGILTCLKERLLTDSENRPEANIKE